MLHSNHGTTAAGDLGREGSASPPRQEPDHGPDIADSTAAAVPAQYEAAAERRMLRAGVKLLSALQEYKDESFHYTNSPSSCLDMDEAMSSLSGLSRQLEQELIQWHQAIGMIEENTQISPKSARGVAWKP